ncbi:MAG: hypothetical protein KC583_21815 [Myxococcales bacterium]|nr:hypothetical protein [Myxococcales bacterium]
MHSYPDGEYRQYTVRVTARDGHGGEDSAEVAVEFIAPGQNRAPSFELVREIAREGFNVTVAASAVDPDGDPLTYAFDWGDGSPTTRNAGGIAVHPYPAGNYRAWPVSVTVEDGRGGQAIEVLEVEFIAPDQNRPPVVEELRLVRQDGFEVLAVVGAVDPDNDPLTYTFDWGDGSAPTVNGGGLAAHRFPIDVFRQYTVTVTVDDGRGGQAQAQADVRYEAPAENQPPVIRDLTLSMGPHGQAELVVEATDPENGPLTWFVAWGDAGNDLVRLAGGRGPHTYPYPVDGEAYAGRVVVSDAAGLEAEADFQALVIDSPTVIRAVNARELRPGTYFFDVIADDADSPNALRYSWDYQSDGIYEIEGSDNSEGAWIYDPPGQYTAHVAVTDPWSGATVEADLVIGENPDGSLPPRIEDVFVEIGPGGQTFVAVDAVDPEGGQLTGEIVWGDSAEDDWRPLPNLAGQHRYAYDIDQVPYAGRVRVTDPTNASAEMPFTAAIADLPTQMNEISVSVVRDGQVTARASARDPDTADLQYAFDFDGDGENDTGWLDDGIAQYEYATSGAKTLIVSVRDTWSENVTPFQYDFDLPAWVVSPPLPDGAVQAEEGQCVAFAVTEEGLATRVAEPVCDRADNPDPELWHWSFGDGTAADGSEVGHRYVDDGAYLAKVQGGPPDAPMSAKIQVAVTNRAPTFVTEPPELATAGGQYAYHIEVTDAGATDEITLKMTASPQGMVLQPDGDRRWLITWDVPADLSGEVTVELRAADGHHINGDWVPDGGTATQRYLIRISGNIDPEFEYDGGIDGLRQDSGAEYDANDFTGSGCACDAGGGSPADLLWGLLGVIGLAAVRRRRRRL